MGDRFYLAYGSNLNKAQMRIRCPTAKAVGTGTIDGYRLLFRGSKTGSYLTIEPKKGESVPVAVWLVSKDDEARLDRYEGFPHFYYRKNFTIPVNWYSGGNARRHKCFVYIMHEDRPLGLPTEAYLQTCIKGYMDFGFDTVKLFDACKAGND